MSKSLMHRNSEYLESLEREFPKPKRGRGIAALDLFAGCGGLALGFESAGFDTVGYEMDGDACRSYADNLGAPCHALKLTPETVLADRAEVIVGGPPCQPFSVTGHQEGRHDDRDGFPAFLAAVERCKPKVVVFENVRGMFYRNRDYFNSIRSKLELLGYIVDWKLLNAVEYGVPQNRERLFVVGHPGNFEFPRPTVRVPFTAGDALGALAGQVPPNAKFLTPSMDAYVAKYEMKSKCIRPRDLHLDRPSRTVTCRNLNGATGDMLRVCLADGQRRRLTVREGARLQGFPDWFEFSGNEGSQFNQIGNAVPPLLAKAVAEAVKNCLEGLPANSKRKSRQLELS